MQRAGVPAGPAAPCSSPWRDAIVRAALKLALAGASLAALAAHLEPRVMMAMVAWVC